MALDNSLSAAEKENMNATSHGAHDKKRPTPQGHQKRVAQKNVAGLNNKTGTRGDRGRFVSTKKLAGMEDPGDTLGAVSRQQ